MPIISSVNMGRQMGQVLTALAPVLEAQETGYLATALNAMPRKGVARVGALRDWLFLLSGSSVFTIPDTTRRTSDNLSRALGLPSDRRVFLTSSTVREIASRLILAASRRN